MTTIVLTQDLIQGTNYSASLPWPGGSTSVTALGLLSNGDATNPLNTCQFAVEASFDGGKSFNFAAGTGWNGGVGRDGITPAPPVIALGYGSNVPTHVRVRIDLPVSLSIGASLSF